VRYEVWLENHGKELTLIYCPMMTLWDDCRQSHRMILTNEQQLKFLRLLLLLFLLLQMYLLWWLRKLRRMSSKRC